MSGVRRPRRRPGLVELAWPATLPSSSADRAHRGQPALGQQRADHQRRDAQPDPDGERHRRGRRAARRLGTVSQRDLRTATTSPPWSRRPSRRPGPGSPARTPRRWSSGPPDADWDDAAGRPPTSRCWPRSRPGSGGRSRRRGPTVTCCSASPSTCVTTTYLGSSTGLRRRGVQPTGRFELNGKTADLTASAWVGRATRDFTDVDVAALYAERRHPAGLGGATDRAAARAATRPCCRPGPSPTC